MNPCGSGSLQTGTKVIAILYMAWSVIFIVILWGSKLSISARLFPIPSVHTDISIDIEISAQEIKKLNHIHDVKDVGACVVKASIVMVVLYVVNLLIAILLFVGATKRNWTMCMVWFVLNAFLFVITTIDRCFGLSEVPEFAAMVGRLLLEVYFMRVVEGPGQVSKPYGNAEGPVSVHHGNTGGPVPVHGGNTGGPVPTDYDNTGYPVPTTHGNWNRW